MRDDEMKRKMAFLALLSVLASDAYSQAHRDSNSTFKSDTTKPLPPEQDTVAFNSLSKLPIPQKQVAPVYPETARVAGVEALVAVRLLIGKEGKPLKVTLKSMRQVGGDTLIGKSLLKYFRKPSFDGVMKWRFSPPLDKNGKPANVWLDIPLQYKLKR